MKILKPLILLVLISLQAGATGYPHNMFVAHKKLQAGKDCKSVQEHVVVKKDASSKVRTKAADASFTRQFANKLSGMVTLNQRVVEEGPSSLFEAEDDDSKDDSIVTKLATVVKGVVYSFVATTALGKS